MLPILCYVSVILLRQTLGALDHVQVFWKPKQLYMILSYNVGTEKAIGQETFRHLSSN